jgi:hypothetical protein
MYPQQTLGTRDQQRPWIGITVPLSTDLYGSGLLGNTAQQVVPSLVNDAGKFEIVESAERILPLENPKRSKLENLKKRHFDPEHKTARIAKSLAALEQKQSIKLSPEEWLQIMEDVDLEDQS